MVRLGAVGLGRAFNSFLPSILSHPRVELVAVADLDVDRLERIRVERGLKTYGTIDALCDDTDIDAIYIATPHQLHASHACLAASAGKHVVVEKPMALTIEDCEKMITAAAENSVVLIVGPSHGMYGPVMDIRSKVASGEYGSLRLVCGIYYNDFLYRPRRPEELSTAEGGGVIFNQLPHHVDIVRTIEGKGVVKSVRAYAGKWDPSRPTEGSYAALLFFESGVVGSLTYSGYAHFDSDELLGWHGESGAVKSNEPYGLARRQLAKANDGVTEAELKRESGYGGRLSKKFADHQESQFQPHFGFTVASCDEADFVTHPEGFAIYGDQERLLTRPESRPAGTGKAIALDELCDGISDPSLALHNGIWGMRNLEVCLAVLESAKNGCEIEVQRRHNIGERN